MFICTCLSHKGNEIKKNMYHGRNRKGSAAELYATLALPTGCVCAGLFPSECMMCIGGSYDNP